MSNYSANLPAAFAEMFPDARPCKAAYVTLYEVQSRYGGPEEGGWYYDWFTPVASQQVADEQTAHDLAEQIREKADQMTTDATGEWARQMLESCEWAEARGIDPADMDEPDGPTRFLVFFENFPGEYETKERPYYS